MVSTCGDTHPMQYLTISELIGRNHEVKQCDETLTDNHEHLFDFIKRFDEHITKLLERIQHPRELAQYVYVNITTTYELKTKTFG